MKNRMRYVGAAVGLCASIAIAQTASNKRIDDKTLRDAAKNGDEWVTYGRDYAETHFSPLKQIDASNVKRLGLAWSVETDSPSGGRVEGTPLYSNGVLYGSLAWDVLFAADARTGRMKWRYDPDIARQPIAGLCCGPVNRGVALYHGKVYAGLLDGRLIALDQETGKKIWESRVIDDPGDILTSAVRVVKGKVIVGNSGAEQAVRGQFSAWDAETGKLAWRFYTVPGDPSKPFENPALSTAAKTWNGDWWKMGGGGTVWDAMAYDPDADILYIGTGNGGPWSHVYRSPGGGDNLYLASVIAVKPETGRMVWYFQETPGDDWDFTSVQPMILADITIDGKPRKVLLHAPKNGFFYVLDRITGEFITGDKYAKRVTWAHGLDSKGRPIEAKGNRATLDAAVTMSPGPGGAHNWQPMAYSPLTGLVYIPGQESSYTYRIDPNFKYEAGGRNLGMAGGLGPRLPNGGTAAPPPPPPAQAPAHEPEGAENEPKATGGFLVAMDPKTAKERWRLTGAPGMTAGGTLATAGNLLFQGPVAYNAETGEKLWESEIGGPQVTPITYMLDGKQYVTMFARGYPDNRLFTFVLDGKAEIPAAKDSAPQGPVVH
jgi:quinohemoprotein ethanol dehydrogenase